MHKICKNNSWRRIILSILAASHDLQSANEKGDSFEMQYLLLIYSPEFALGVDA